MEQGNTLIKCSCGYYNQPDAIRCAFCGKDLNPKQDINVIFVFEDEQSGFPVLRTLKKYKDINLKTFKPTTVFISNIEKADFLIFMVDVNSIRNREILTRLRHKFKSAKTIAFLVDESDFKEWEKLKIDYIVSRRSMIEDIITKGSAEAKNVIPFPIYSIKYTENLLSSLRKEEKAIIFLFDKFDVVTISRISGFLEEIYNNLKRSDVFLVVSNFGFIILPSNQNNYKGMEFLKNKIEEEIKSKEDLHKYFRSSFLKRLSDFERLMDLMDKEEKSSPNEITQSMNISNSRIGKSEFLNFENPYLMMITINDLGEDAALLFFDDEYRNKIQPFLTLRMAKKIVDIKKDGFSSSSLRRAKEKFLNISESLSERFDIIREKDFLESLSADTQLFSLPEIQTNILMSYKEDAPFRRIVNEIQKDPAITSKILRFANSAFFGFKSEIRSLERAAVILGMEEVLGISLSVSYLNIFKSKLSRKLYKYAIATLAISKYIEKKANISASITLGSVIHVIGNMFYAQFMENNYKKLIKHIEESNERYEKAETLFLPARSSEVGFRLSSLWSFPERVGQVIRNWFFPAFFSKFDTSLHLVHAAAVMARALGYFYPGYSLEDMSYHTYTLFFKKFNLNLLSLFKSDRDKIKEKIDEMMYVLS